MKVDPGVKFLLILASILLGLVGLGYVADWLEKDCETHGGDYQVHHVYIYYIPECSGAH